MKDEANRIKVKKKIKTELEKKRLKSLQDKISRYRAKIIEEGKKGQVIRQIYESFQDSDEENQENSTLPTKKTGNYP